MGFTASVVKATLSSYSVRTVVTGTTDGIRSIRRPDKEKGESALGNIWKLAANFVGWIWGAVSFGYGVATFIVSLFWQGVRFIWNFNWNASDDELDRQWAQFKSSLLGKLGDTLGNLAGWLLCGVAPGAFIFSFNEVLGLLVLTEVGEEAFEELLMNVRMLCMTLFQGLATKFFIEIFKGIRRVLKLATRGWGSIFDQVGQKVLGDKWNTAKDSHKNNKPWSFAIAYEEILDLIGKFAGEGVKELIENFGEEFMDSCQEASYVVAGGIDAWVMEQKLQQTSLLGGEELVEIRLNRETEESIVLAGPQELMKPAIVQTLSLHQILDDKEFGLSLNGQDPLEANHVYDDDDNIELIFRLCSNDKPPFNRGKNKPGYKYQEAQITVPRVQRSSLTWDKLIKALGGKNGYFYGSHQYTAHLINKTGQGVGKIIAATSSEKETQDLLASLAELTDCKINTIERGGLIKYGESGLILHKDPIKVYPRDVVVINNKKVGRLQKGRKNAIATTNTNYSCRIDLWGNNPPTDFKDLIAEIFKYD